MNLQEIKDSLQRLCDVIYSAGMDEESQELREISTYLIEQIENGFAPLKIEDNPEFHKLVSDSIKELLGED